MLGGVHIRCRHHRGRRYGGCARDTSGYAGSFGAVHRQGRHPTQDLLVNLSESLACDFAFDLESTRRECALGIAQLIEVSRLLAERVLDDVSRAARP